MAKEYRVVKVKWSKIKKDKINDVITNGYTLHSVTSYNSIWGGQKVLITLVKGQ